MSPLEWWRRRRTTRHLKHEARRTRALWEDVLPPDVLERVDRAMEHLEAARRAGTREAFEAACAEVQAAVEAARPARRWPVLAENFEVIVVALTLAMAIRCFFIQPFRIPTGSMSPTLRGIEFERQDRRHWYDYPPVSWVIWALFGEGYVEVRARCDGFFSPQAYETPDRDYIIFIDRTPHRIRRNMPMPWRRQPGDYVRRGEVIASGRMRLGDFVLVNKVVYHFRRPRRGEVVVFETEGIDHPQIRPREFYIKRLVALPGERVQIHPPWLVINGERIVSLTPFDPATGHPRPGYAGYELADPRLRPRPWLALPDDSLDVPADRYLVLGDNTHHSLDGRYFGPVPWRNIVGPAIAVYWPLSRRWGSIP